MSSEPPLRVGIVGLGVGEQHIAGFESAGAEVLALCDIDPVKLAEVGARHPGKRLAADPVEVLGAPDLDVISVASYDEAHAPQVLAALEAGKHVFVEKPLCLSREEAASIHRALAAHPDLRLSSNLILRACPRFRELRDQMRAGELGEIYYMEGDYTYGRLHKLTEGWRGRPDQFYSVVYGGAVHLIDLLLWLTGDTVVEVMAASNRIATRGTRFRHPDLVVSILRFESGALAKVTANFACVHPHFHPLQIFGTDGSFLNGQATATRYTSRDPAVAPVQVETPYPGVHKGDLISSFLGAIRGEGPAEVTEADVFRTMAVAFAIQQAAEVGGTVPVHYL